MKNINYKEIENTNLFSIKGRISRSLFWAQHLLIILYVFIVFIDDEVFSIIPHIALPFIIPLLYFPIIIVTIATYIKRLHDMNKSGWYYCIQFIPILGNIILLLWCGISKGTVGENQYGGDPYNENTI